MPSLQLGDMVETVSFVFRPAYTPLKLKWGPNETKTDAPYRRFFVNRANRFIASLMLSMLVA